MERTMSIEDKIRRAEEIYARRHESEQRKTATVTVNENKSARKDIKLLKKMIIQIIVSLAIYLVVYIINNNNYIFSKDFLDKAREILSYDMNFAQTYQDLKNNMTNGFLNLKNALNQKENIDENGTGENELNSETTNSEETSDGAIGGATENGENLDVGESSEITSNEDNSNKELTQEEKDVETIKQTTSFIKPIEGTISSRYGHRNPTTQTVPQNHTGIDIAANLGTKIKSATEGEVVIASEEGDYGKHLKIQVGDVSIIYAHCSNLYVKQGDRVTQGQEIAEVGSTGNSTGPHLHFEIRVQERTINPEQILTF